MAVIQGRYHTRQAQTAHEVETVQALRAIAFAQPSARGLDQDRFDDICTHFLVFDRADNTLVCGFRTLLLASGAEISRSYAAQYYDLSALEAFPGPMVEVGRFCVRPGDNSPDILRLAWGAIAAYVDAHNVQMLFGCSSFAGTETAQYLDAFAMLRARHLGPKRWLPQVKAPDVFRFAARLRRRPDAKKAMMNMPPLLRSYLLIGGWVSDHAVVDRQMNTLHVFTGLDVGAISAARKKLLRAGAG
jgi:putative hemolysin